jgi:hypothetical protein
MRNPRPRLLVVLFDALENAPAFLHHESTHRLKEKSEAKIGLISVAY